MAPTKTTKTTKSTKTTTMKKSGGVKYDTLPKKGGYSEPGDYFPKETRKKYGLGEYAKKATTKKK